MTSWWGFLILALNPNSLNSLNSLTPRRSSKQLSRKSSLQVNLRGIYKKLVTIARKCYSTLKSRSVNLEPSLHFSSLAWRDAFLSLPLIYHSFALFFDFSSHLGHNKVVMHDSLWSRIGTGRACCVGTKWAHSLRPGSVTGPGQWDKDNIAGTFPNWWKQKDSNHSEVLDPLVEDILMNRQLSELM